MKKAHKVNKLELSPDELGQIIGVSGQFIRRLFQSPNRGYGIPVFSMNGNHYRIAIEDAIIYAKKYWGIDIVSTVKQSSRPEEKSAINQMENLPDDQNEILELELPKKVKGSKLIVPDDKHCFFVNRQSGKGKDHFVSVSLLRDALVHFNNGKETRFQLSDLKGNIIFDENIKETIHRLKNSCASPRDGEDGEYLIIDSFGRWKP